MSVNRVVRGGLFVVGLVAGLLFFSFAHQARFDGAAHSSHTRFGMESSPWLVIDSQEVNQGGKVSSNRKAEFSFTSWSWAALAASAATFWVRRRFTSPDPELPAIG